MNTNKFLKWVIYISLAIIPFLAFYVSGFGINVGWNAMLFPYITGKNFAFRILVEIAAAAWVMLMILNKNYRPKKSIILWIYSAFIFVLLLADIFSVNPTRAFFSNFERMEGFISHAHLFLYFLIMISMFKDKAIWTKYKMVLFISNIPVILLALLQLIGLSSFSPMNLLPSLRDAVHKYFAPSQGGNQLDSSLGNSSYLAIYTVFFIFLFTISLVEARFEKKKNYIAYIVMILLNLIVLFYTQTRGAQIGFAFGIFVSAIILYFGGKKFSDLKILRKVSLGIVSVILLGFVGLISLKNTNFIQNSSNLNRLAKVASFANPVTLFTKVGEIKTELYNPNSTYTSLLAISGDGTFTSRLLNIKMAIEGFKDRPILGWGQDNYFYVFANHNDSRMYAQETWFDRTHNVFMDWLIAAGVLGLLAYLALYFSAIWTMWFSKYTKSHKNTKQEFIEKTLLTGLLVAYFIHNIFVFDNLVSYILFFIVLAYINFSFNKKEEEIVKNTNDEKTKVITWGPVIVIVLAISLYCLNIVYIRANIDIMNGLAPQAQAGEKPVDTLYRSLDSFKKAISIGGIAKVESREQLAQQTLNIIGQISSAKIPQTEEYSSIYKLGQDYIDTTKSAYMEILDIKNPDPRSLSIFSMFLSQIGDNDTALKYGKMAYDKAPNKQTIAIEYVKELLTNKDFETANQIAKSIYDKDTSFTDSKNIYILTSIYNKDFDTAEKLLIDESGKANIDGTIASAYVSVGSDNKVISLLNKNISLNKEDVSSMLLLAQVYEATGNRSESILELNKISEVKPELKSQVEDYIKNMK